MSEPKVIKRMAPTFISPEINLPIQTRDFGTKSSKYFHFRSAVTRKIL